MVNKKFHFLVECAGGQTMLAREMNKKGCGVSCSRISQWYTELQHHPKEKYIPVLLEIACEIGLNYTPDDLRGK